MASSPAINIASLKPVIEWPDVPQGAINALKQAVQIELEQIQLEKLPIRDLPRHDQAFSFTTYVSDTSNLTARTISQIGVMNITNQAIMTLADELERKGIEKEEAKVTARNTYDMTKEAYSEAYKKQANANGTSDALKSVINAFSTSLSPSLVA